MKTDTICMQTLYHIEKIIELVESTPNDSDLGYQIRLYIKELNKNEQRKDRADKQ